jgi:hypothetical protein
MRDHDVIETQILRNLIFKANIMYDIFALGYSYIIQVESLRPLLDQSNQMVRQTGHYSCLIGCIIPQV